MGLISKPTTYATGGTVSAANLNALFDTIYDAFNGNISNANIVDGAAIAWAKVNKAGSSVDDLADVNLDEPSDGQVLEYDGDTDRWVNVSPSTPASLPSGAILWSGCSYDAIPSGYLLCAGAAVSRSTYSALFAVIGTKFGVGDGSTTFNLPSLIDRFAQGIANATTNPGATGGATAKTTGNATGGFSTQGGGSDERNSPAHTHSISDIRPKYLELVPIIKT